MQRIYFMGSTGPTGPSGKGLEILGSYGTLGELMDEQPTCDSSTAKIDFANVNLIVKKYNVSV